MNTEAQELTLTEALDVLLYKARNNRLIRRRHKLLLRENERKIHPPIKEFMDYMTKELKAGLSGMRGKTPTQKAKSIANWGEIRERGEEILKPVLFDILNSGAMTAWKQGIKKQERFDPIGIEAVNWTTARSATLIAEITQETMYAIRDVITTGIHAGKSIPVIARELRPIVGLNSQYAGAVSNFHTSLLAEGVAASKAAIRAESYAGRLHRRRATTIARTETAFGLTEGQRQGYDHMGVKNLERVEDPDCCDICAEYNGKIYSVKEAEGVLPEHPNCEGTWIMAGEMPPAPPEIGEVVPGMPGEVPEWKAAKTVAEAEKWGKQYGIEILHEAGKTVELKYINAVNREMSKIPKDLLLRIQKNKGKLHMVANNGITIHPAFRHLKGQRPRGWTTGSWDTIPGAGGTTSNPTTVIVANKTAMTYHGSINLTLHEYGHAVDALAKKGWAKLSDSTKWQKVWKGNNKRGLISSPYQAGYAEEYWAEAFAEYLNTVGHGALPKNVITYFDNLIKELGGV